MAFLEPTVCQFFENNRPIFYIQGTHNRYFETIDLLQENLVEIFERMNKPEIVQTNLKLFYNSDVK